MIFYHITFLSILCSCVYVYGHVCVLACMGSSKDNLSERALFSHHVGFRGQTQLVRLVVPVFTRQAILSMLKHLSNK